MDVLHLTERNRTIILGRVASILERGGVVAVPTDTVYGLCADVLREAAVRKVFRIKMRSHLKAMPVFVRDIANAKKFAYIDGKLARILEGIWPGQTTVVLRKKDAMPDLVTGGDATVGLRIPDNEFLQEVMAKFPNPITATSANLSGAEPCRTATEVQNIFLNANSRPDLIVDAGELPPSDPSTILDLTYPANPKILRIGATSREKVMELLAHWEKP